MDSTTLPVLPTVSTSEPLGKTSPISTTTSTSKNDNTVLKKISEVVTNAISEVFLPKLVEFCNKTPGPYTVKTFRSVLKLQPSNVSLPNGMPTGLPTILNGTGSAPKAARVSGKRRKTDGRQCLYRYTRGDKKNQRCTSKCVLGNDVQMCNTHSKTPAGKKQWRKWIAENGGAASVSSQPSAPMPASTVNSAPPPAASESTQIQVNQDTDGNLVTSDGLVVEQGTKNGVVFAVAKRERNGTTFKDRPLNADEKIKAKQQGFSLKVASPVGSILPSIPGAVDPIKT